MENYKPNSHKYKAEQKEKAATEERKKIEKVTNGVVRVKKKSETRKFLDNLMGDQVQDIKSSIKNDYIIPAIRNTIWDVFTNTLDMILFGGTGGHARRRSTSEKISYRSYYDDRRSDSRRYDDRRERSRNSYDLDELVLETRGEAQAVLNAMDNIMDEYKIVSVADMYDLIGETCPYTAYKYGWTNIRNAEIVRVRDGYIIRMPKAMPID